MSKDNFTYVDTQNSLETACKELSAERVLCVDTEFHRESTYYPEFALMQIYGGKRCWLIDPLAIKDLSPLWEILTNPEILKVFHAGFQDIEIIFQESGKLPTPMFDTQIAAALLGYGQQVGFGNLVQRILKKELAKGESFSDWLARPLNSKQLQYAADDVIWLMPIFQHLRDQLKIRKRESWLHEEQSNLCNLQSFEQNVDEFFWRVKGVNKLKGASLSALRALAAWRETEARKRNLPRRRLISDEVLVDIAKRSSLDEETLSRMRGLSQGTVKRFGEHLIEAWHKGVHAPSESWPKLPSRSSNTRGTEMRLELLSTLLRLKAEDGEIASCILSSKSELSALASWGLHRKNNPPKLPCLEGWRYELVGHDLLRLLNGEICLHLNPETGLPEITDINGLRQ
ncbi:MAG: ribonuclease D [Zetaproteobacteria bacterium CG_4_9_14_3_um_filter_49_83]|nr:MAG: ribonuclease D [Zetaproteobacteria bacterium CG1_02_49_23]PIQ30721.1 MAG: ribonuclease D [Zetaproteobacteria bacterium CG17_big_fil_post_rev_8_21_14_2_50_50_13]PIV30728.1 MAG: ribonuclease D [Zetaproteobacteria bacterium CG02_land_8_20_14_3_00_50_9]PIY56844.1 MAG: ribonuclease D [Zetaproteobacteria bacterium CG_4_10_14_0_8_um_filter_49_80]PJA35146.1 MAG: ribonuclease D [Zetaproteobacteria bacterium CG_4_9_14_3_um_filter_49_83]